MTKTDIGKTKTHIAQPERQPETAKGYAHWSDITRSAQIEGFGEGAVSLAALTVAIHQAK